MRTVTKIKTNTDALQFGYWDADDKEFVPISGMNTRELKEAADILGCSPLLLDALAMMVETISQVVGDDLRDIWRRL